MWLEIGLLLSMVIILLVSYFWTKDILHPSVMLNITFVIDVAFYIFMKIFTHSKYTLLPTTFIFSLGLIIFFVGTLIGGRFRRFEPEPFIDNEKREITNIYKVVIIVQLIIVFLYVIDIFVNADVVNKTFIDYIRAEKAEVYTSRYIFRLTREFSYACSYMALYQLITNANNMNKKYLCLQLLVTGIFLMFNTSRGHWFRVFIPMIMIVLLTHYSDRKIILRHIGIAFVIMFVICLLVTIARKQNTTLEEIRCYLNSGIIQFTEWLKLNEPKTNGQYIARLLLKQLKRLGLYDKKLLFIDMRYLKIPHLDWKIGNVFTFYHGFTRDFGLGFAMIMNFLIALGHGIIYFYSKTTKKVFWLLMYALFTYPLVLQFFNDFYTGWNSDWIKTIIVFLVLCNTSLLYRKVEERKIKAETTQ